MITDCSLREQQLSSFNFLEGRRQVTLPKTKRAVTTLTFPEDRPPFRTISLWTDWQPDGPAGSPSCKAGFSSIGSKGLFGGRSMQRRNGFVIRLAQVQIPALVLAAQLGNLGAIT